MVDGVMVEVGHRPLASHRPLHWPSASHQFKQSLLRHLDVIEQTSFWSSDLRYQRYATGGTGRYVG